MQSAETTEQVCSRLADDPDLAEQVEQFVASLPELIATLRMHADGRDWNSLQGDAHRLKGSSGCYGFDGISERAARLELECRQNPGEAATLDALAELEELCGRVDAKRRPK